MARYPFYTPQALAELDEELKYIGTDPKSAGMLVTLRGTEATCWEGPTKQYDDQEQEV